MKQTKYSLILLGCSLNVLKDELAKDHITTRLIDMTPLGLVEITRQRIRKSIYEL